MPKSPHKTQEFPIGALATESGVNIETIRYYEKIGVMPKPSRSASGYRLYAPEHLKRLTFIRRGRELGFTLDELRGLLRLVDGHSYTCAEVRTLTLDHVADIRRKIADLKRLERVMTNISSRCSGKRIPDCPIVDALFQPGPLAGGTRVPGDSAGGTPPRSGQSMRSAGTRPTAR